MSDSKSYSESISSSYADYSDSEYNILPYQFEPIVVRRNQDDGGGDNLPDVQAVDIADRIGNTDWCKCNCCEAMPTQRESVCCQEIEQTNYMMEVFNAEGNDVECLTDHPGFRTVCLDRYVIEVAYYQYRQQYGIPPQQDHEQQRYVAYRQLVRWCWGYLGKDIRVVLPACVVKKIRLQFPSTEYRGYEDV